MEVFVVGTKYRNKDKDFYGILGVFDNLDTANEAIEGHLDDVFDSRQLDLSCTRFTINDANHVYFDLDGKPEKVN